MRKYYYLNTYICGVASFAYFAMFSGKACGVAPTVASAAVGGTRRDDGAHTPPSEAASDREESGTSGGRDHGMKPTT